MGTKRKPITELQMDQWHGNNLTRGSSSRSKPGAFSSSPNAHANGAGAENGNHGFPPGVAAPPFIPMKSKQPKEGRSCHHRHHRHHHHHQSQDTSPDHHRHQDYRKRKTQESRRHQDALESSSYPGESSSRHHHRQKKYRRQRHHPYNKRETLRKEESTTPSNSSPTAVHHHEDEPVPSPLGEEGDPIPISPTREENSPQQQQPKHRKSESVGIVGRSKKPQDVPEDPPAPKEDAPRRAGAAPLKKKVFPNLSQGQIIQNQSTTSAYHREFKVISPLGKGGFSCCYQVEAMWKNQHLRAREFAMKVTSKKMLYTKQREFQIHTEIQVHKRLRHRHIVEFFDHFEDDQQIYILLELCEGATLDRYVKEHRYLTEEKARPWFAQLLDGVEYIHSQLVIHRDLKLSNLFVSQQGKLKIGDFGLAAQLTSAHDKRKECCGTTAYLAPEIFYEPIKKDGYSFSVDVWSMTVILFTMLTGRTPFHGGDKERTYSNIKHVRYAFPETPPLSSSVRQLIDGVFRLTPSSRLTLPVIRRHQWICDYMPASCTGPSLSCSVSSLSSSSSFHQTASSSRAPFANSVGSTKSPIIPGQSPTTVPRVRHSAVASSLSPQKCNPPELTGPTSILPVVQNNNEKLLDVSDQHQDASPDQTSKPNTKDTTPITSVDPSLLPTAPGTYATNSSPRRHSARKISLSFFKENKS